MRASRCGILVISLLAASLHPTAAAAQTTRLGPSVAAIPTYTKGSNVAYDYKNGVYLVVSAFGNLNGVFVTADGAVGTPFTIQGPYTHFPGVAYSPDLNGGAGGFLVSWHQTVGNGAMVHAKTVTSTGVLGPDIPISVDGSWWEASVDVAYSTTSKEFLVVWQGIGIRGQRVALSGALLGTNIAINVPIHGRDPGVAYNPTTNEFFVSFGDIDAASSYAGGQRIAAGSGALVGAQIVLGRAAGVYITDVAYNSTTNQYLASWWQGGTYGVLVNASGALVSGVVPLSLTVSAYDALSVSFNATSGTFLMTSHMNTSYQDGAVELAGATATAGSPIVATDIAATKGNFYPKVASRIGKSEWLLSTATDFVATTVQRLGSGGTVVGPPPPPPPPAPCTATPTKTSISIPNGGVTFPIDVTTSTTTCAWTATSATSWLQIGAGGTSTGPASVAVVAQPNWSLSPRTGTISVSGKTVTVSQAGYSPAAVHDFTGDSFSDVMWWNASTGAAALWGLKSNLVTLTTSMPSVPNTAWKIVGTGDLNGDGYSDYVWQSSSGDIAAWLMRGATMLAGGMLNYPNVGTKWKVRGVGDLNGDNRCDIVFQHDDGWLAVWFMNQGLPPSSYQFVATATLFLSVPKMTDPNWVIAGAGDINGDGMADIIWQNQANGMLGAWLMNGTLAFAQSGLSVAANTDLHWKIRGVGDIDGDGRADLIWQNVVTGETAAWFLNWFTVLSQQRLYFPNAPAVVPDTNWQIVGPG